MLGVFKWYLGDLEIETHTFRYEVDELKSTSLS